MTALEGVSFFLGRLTLSYFPSFQPMDFTCVETQDGDKVDCETVELEDDVFRVKIHGYP